MLRDAKVQRFWEHAYTSIVLNTDRDDWWSENTIRLINTYYANNPNLEIVEQLATYGRSVWELGMQKHGKCKNT